MDFTISEEHRMLQELVARFVADHLLPLERIVLERDSCGGGAALTAAERAAVDNKSRELGLWGLDAPSEFGGADLPMQALVGVNEELGATITPYLLPPDSPNLRMLMSACNAEQRAQYLAPYARGDTISAIAISEPGAGSDPAGMITRAVRDGNHWVLNGRKIWISSAEQADFTIVLAVTDKSKGARGGISAFLVDKGTTGFNVLRRIPMIAGRYTYELALEDCRIPAEKLLGEEGKGFAPMQLRLAIRRLQMACWCIGIARRALEMICAHAPQRTTFGARLSERQAIQWWVADAATKIHACRLMAYDAACKIDRGVDARTEVSMIKVFATEMAWDIADKAMQVYGGMGMAKEIPLQMMAARVRLMRIYEGPTEIHRWVIAREKLGLRR